MMKTTEKTVKPINENRDRLIKLSVKARSLRKEKIENAESSEDALFWASMSINDIIAMWYREQSGAKVFKTFNQWREEGYLIKKGAKAFVLWARRQKGKDVAVKQEGGEPEYVEYKFYPITYLFSEQQVEIPELNK
jgi:hypothetical protein